MSDWLVIEGLTEDGRRFRPSDWAERLASSAATFGADRRLRFSPRLRPLAEVDGVKALAVSLQLQYDDPTLWRQVLDFTHANGLRVKGLASDEPIMELALAS